MIMALDSKVTRKLGQIDDRLRGRPPGGANERSGTRGRPPPNVSGSTPPNRPPPNAALAEEPRRQGLKDGSYLGA
jgi:hypothetical protein